MNAFEIEERVKQLKKELAKGNPFGEEIYLVAATKTQSEEMIAAAIAGGVDAVAENRVQEFLNKQNLPACPKHFIGRLQTNKVKYLVGNVALIHSCDRDDLAAEIAKKASSKGVIQPVLLQVNIGNEESKGGYDLGDAYAAFERWSNEKGLEVQGFMAMLPAAGDEQFLGGLVDKMRDLFEKAKAADARVKFLSVGMSGDYRLCVAHGSNMVRLGSTIFGNRT
jgi:pyridoxal phosphate enzyme (YggS family)